MNSNDKIKRRRFLRKIWTTLGVLAGLEIIYIILNFLHPKKAKTTTSEELFDAGSIEDFKKNSITSFRNRSFFLSRLSNGNFLALSSRCTHLGCALNYNSSKNRLECPCHSSLFNIKGEVLRSPATKHLQQHKVFIKHNHVMVVTNSIISNISKLDNITIA